MNDGPSVSAIKAEVRARTGSDSPELSATIHYLERHGRELYTGEEDLALYEIYRDALTTGTIQTFADLVIPGRRTLASCPGTQRYGLHFRKRYTPNSPPIRRGETPEVEFQRTQRALTRLPADLGFRLEPLSFEPWIYRARVIPGQTYAALSPFSDLSYEEAIATPFKADAAQLLEARIERCYAVVGAMHAAGVAHGDLHLDNMMWVADAPENPVQLIDLASCFLREEESAWDWAEGVADDLSELLREAGLLQLALRRRLLGACAQAAVQRADDLFPDNIAELFLELR